MEVEINPPISKSVNITHTDQNDLVNGVSLQTIIEYLIKDKNIYLKNQQRGESEMTFEDKSDIIKNVYNKGPMAFLLRFGKYLSTELLNFFVKFENDSKEIKQLLQNLIQTNAQKAKRTRNRRFAALRDMIEKESYFSETEMMKRNPLLYDQLVGQYLTAEEKKRRDVGLSQTTLVGILMEGLERDEAEAKKKRDEIDEMNASDSEESSEDDRSKTETYSKKEQSESSTSQPTSSHWGEYTNQNVSTSPWGEMTRPSSMHRKQAKSSTSKLITASERELLKDEFVTTMYENFLEGKDEDFDYTKVDENEEFDNLEIIDRDEEEKYFDSEEPEDYEMEEDKCENKRKQESKENESSEDELDTYMSALNQHPAVSQLSKDIEHL